MDGEGEVKRGLNERKLTEALPATSLIGSTAADNTRKTYNP